MVIFLFLILRLVICAFLLFLKTYYYLLSVNHKTEANMLHKKHTDIILL